MPTTIPIRERNRATSQQEVADFERDQPERYFAYCPAKPSGFDPIARLHTGDKVTTWMGDELATVSWSGDPFRGGFGEIRQNFRAKAINGATYSGTAYLSAGDYVRMRRVAA